MYFSLPLALWSDILDALETYAADEGQSGDRAREVLERLQEAADASE